MNTQKLADMGTTGLVQFATKCWRMRGCRMAQAVKVIEARKGPDAVGRFRAAVAAEWRRQAAA